MLNFEQQLLARLAEVHAWIDGLQRVAVAQRVAGAQGPRTDPTEWARLADIEARALAELHAVDRALQRLKLGTFGLCQECGEPMSFLYLEVRPWVATCQECEAAQVPVSTGVAAHEPYGCSSTPRE